MSKKVEEFEDTVDAEAVARGTKVSRLSVSDPCSKNLRICPPLVRGLFYKEYGAHYDVSGLIAAAPVDMCACLRLTLNQICPICVDVKRLYKEADQGATKDQIKQAKANRHRGKVRYLMNVIDCDNLDNGVMIWDLNKEAFGWLKTLFMKDKFIVSAHPEKGKAINVTWSRKMQWVAPSQILPADDKPQYTGPIRLEDWKNYVHDLDAYVESLTYTAADIKTWVAESSSAPRRFDIVGDEDLPDDSSAQLEVDPDEETAELTPEMLNDPQLQAALKAVRQRHR